MFLPFFVCLFVSLFLIMLWIVRLAKTQLSSEFVFISHTHLAGLPISKSWWQEHLAWKSTYAAGSIPFLTLTPEQKGDTAVVICFPTVIFPFQHSEPFPFWEAYDYVTDYDMSSEFLHILHLITLRMQVPHSLILTTLFLRSDSSSSNN